MQLQLAQFDHDFEKAARSSLAPLEEQESHTIDARLAELFVARGFSPFPCLHPPTSPSTRLGRISRLSRPFFGRRQRQLNLEESRWLLSFSARTPHPDVVAALGYFVRSLEESDRPWPEFRCEPLGCRFVKGSPGCAGLDSHYVAALVDRCARPAGAS